MADVLAAFEGTIRQRIHCCDTYRQVSQYLRTASNSIRGLSARSVRRFCRLRGIHYRSNLSEDELDAIVHHFVSRVGHTYGKRSLHGLLHSEGIHVSQQRLGMSLFRTYPLALSQRRYTVLRSVNPVLYRAKFFGEKIHLDQNEKLAVYGIVHVAAVDGFSRKIVGFSTMPRKNPITIYNTLFRPLLVCDGIWDQVRTDHGTEFTIVATVQ